MTPGDQAIPGMMDDGATTLVQATPIVMVTTALTTTRKGKGKCQRENQRDYARWSSLSKRVEGRPLIKSMNQQSRFADSLLPQSALIAEVTIMDILPRETRSQIGQGN